MMRATANVTRYATGDVPETCVIPTDPTRPDPNRPYCKYKWSPLIHSVTYVTPEAATAWMRADR